MQSNGQSKLEDTIYFNVTVPYNPDTNGNSPAIYQAQLNQPIVYKPEDYFMALVRFRVSGANIPTMIARIQPFPNTNLNNTIYSVTLTYNGFTSGQTFVQFVPSNVNAMRSQPLTAAHPIVDYTEYYYIYEYTDFLNMINTALQTAFTALDAASGSTLPAGSVAPYFILDPTTLRLSLIAQQAHYDTGNGSQVPAPPALPIEIFMNDNLYQYFDGMPILYLGYNQPAGMDVQMDVQNLYNTNWYNPPGPATVPPNPLTLLEMKQQFDALADWNSLQTIQLSSNLLPVVREFVPQANQQNGIVSSFGILSDFVPLVTQGPEFRTSIEYVADLWRFLTLTANNPITRIDLTFSWTDELGTVRIINIPNGETATAKILFMKKDVASAYINNKQR